MTPAAVTLDRATVEQMREKAGWALETTRMAKSGYAPRKAELAEQVRALAEDWLRQEAALKVATDTLEAIAGFYAGCREPDQGHSPCAARAREALAAIRQEREPYSSEFPDLPLDEEETP